MAMNMDFPRRTGWLMMSVALARHAAAHPK
jgi:hypothetical protein